jgi:hypothetical protein
VVFLIWRGKINGATGEPQLDFGDVTKMQSNNSEITQIRQTHHLTVIQPHHLHKTTTKIQTAGTTALPKQPPSTKNTPPLKPSPEQGMAAETPYQKSPPYTTNTTPTKPLLKQRNQH